MTIPEACSLVLKAGGVGENGGLYLLDMGEPVYIRDLAKQMIRFYGFEPDKDIKIEYIGTRPGERLDESLWADNEEPVPTDFNRILNVRQHNPEHQNQIMIETILDQLCPIIHYDPDKAEMYRNSSLLHQLLLEALPSMRSRQEEAVQLSQKIKELAL
jgi:FlaA1/EpsC-like NDP-sugar epimerase